MATDSFIPISLEDFYSTTPLGAVDRAVTKTVYGINHRQTDPHLPPNRDSVGLLFMTRPQLNLDSNNIRAARRLYKLLSDNPLSIERFVRVTLDPRLQTNAFDREPLRCPLVDPHQAFIPLVTNTAKGASGWPDLTVDTYTSPAGNYKEQYSQVDGISDIYEAWSLDITFKNTGMNILLYMFYIWNIYQSLVFEGKLLPYPDYLSYNTIDYMTRVYRITLDSYKNRVTMISSTGVSFPTTAPIGGFFDYNKDRPYNEQIKEITIRFQSLGARYMDDILLYEFNKAVQIFNPYMSDKQRGDNMVKLTGDWKTVFNNKGYPRIDYDTLELEWWVFKEDFERKKRLLGDFL